LEQLEVKTRLNSRCRKIGIALILLMTVAPAALQPHAHSHYLADPSESGVSEARLARIRHGINTSHWFSQVAKSEGYTKLHFDTHTTARDIALIKSMGFDHIRFSVEPSPMFNPADPGNLPADYLGHLDSAIDMILAGGLAVIVDIHPSDEFKLKLNKDDKHVEAFAGFWRAFARHLSRRDPGRVFLEVINEPMVEDGYRWAGIQSKLVAAMREGAPLHTIIATGHRWSSLYELTFLEPVADQNVIYNFHFYEPMPLTHQGATWAGDFLSSLKGVPYPSSPQAVAKLLTGAQDEGARTLLRHYGEQQWDARRIESEIAKVAAWAEKRRVRVTCNEFGVYRKFSPPSARAAWIHDVRTALEKYAIGWAMWDYQGGFAVVNKVNGKVEPDSQSLEALGLQSTTRLRQQ
jgi:endoglucanase